MARIFPSSTDLALAFFQSLSDIKPFQFFFRVNVDFFPTDNNDILSEFIELVSSANVDNLALVTAKRHTIMPKYFVGTGKADEIKYGKAGED